MHKLLFKQALRYSEDIDLVQTRAAPIGTTVDAIRDAYEYLMQHFATESGKSKGQFYTPAEVSRVIAAVLGIATAPTTHQTTVYDPTCGSGSLLLKVADAALPLGPPLPAQAGGDRRRADGDAPTPHAGVGCETRRWPDSAGGRAFPLVS